MDYIAVPDEHTSEGGRDDRGVPYHAESILSSAQVLKSKQAASISHDERSEYPGEYPLTPQSKWCSGLPVTLPAILLEAEGNVIERSRPLPQLQPHRLPSPLAGWRPQAAQCDDGRNCRPPPRPAHCA